MASRPVLMTSYTYDPLIGITSMTTPNGTKTTYPCFFWAVQKHPFK